MIDSRIFKANDIRGVVTGLSPEWDLAGAHAIGIAAAEVLGIADGNGALVLGRDMRTTSPEFAAAFADGVLSRGGNVIDIGLASTDELWFASGHLDLPGVMFTASHNPGNYNGAKFCHAQARPMQPAELVAIRDRALALSDEPSEPAATPGRLTQRDLLPAYAEHLHSLVDLSGIRRLKVVVDAGNGMGGLTTPAVLGSANLELIGLYLDLDGGFPNHPPNPLEPANLVDAQAAVREHGADLAVVFDHHPGLPGKVLGGLSHVTLFDDHYRALLPAGHRHASGAASLPLRALAGESWIGGRTRSTWFRIVQQACRTAGFEPRTILATDDYRAVQAFVAAGLGVAVVPGLAAAHPLPGIVVRELPTAPARRISVARLPGEPVLPQVRAMTDILIDVTARLRRPPDRRTDQGEGVHQRAGSQTSEARRVAPPAS